MKFVKIESRWCIRYRGRTWRQAKWAQAMGVSLGLAQSLRGRMPMTDDEVDEHIENAKYRKARGIAQSVPIYKLSDGTRFIRKDIEEQWRIPDYIARKMIRFWQQGKLESPFDYPGYLKLCQQGYKACIEGAISQATGEWMGLSNRERRENLAKIPGPTKYERRLWK